MVQRLGDDGAMRLLRIHDGIIREALARHEGLEVKHTGDGIMASFDSVQAALACAVAIQQGFAAHNASHPEPPLMVRIGMSAGEPVAESDDLFGAAVQLAARLCDYAQPGRHHRLERGAGPGDRQGLHVRARRRGDSEGLPRPGLPVRAQLVGSGLTCQGPHPCAARRGSPEARQLGE